MSALRNRLSSRLLRRLSAGACALALAGAIGPSPQLRMPQAEAAAPPALILPEPPNAIAARMARAEAGLILAEARLERARRQLTQAHRAWRDAAAAGEEAAIAQAQADFAAARRALAGAEAGA